MVLLGSTLRGLRAMKRNHAKVTWQVDVGHFGFWVELWTPIWNEGRGPYVSLGLGIIRILRGY